MSTKKFIVYLVMGTMIFCFFIGSERKSKASPGENYSSSHQAMVKLFQNNPQEPKAKDAVWTSPDMFKVGVIDDRSSRDGYAMYVCEVLNQNGFRGKDIGVQIIDIIQLTAKGSWVKLGEARCN